MPRVLFILQSAFSLWMLVDALGRPGIGRYWYFVVLMPFGEWFYFFKYKIHDRELAWLKAPFTRLAERPVSLDQLRYRAEEAPSIHNQLLFAQALYDAAQYRDAEQRFAHIVANDDDCHEAQYGLGLARFRLDEFDAAVEALSALVARVPSHDDYQGWIALSNALWNAGRQDDALAEIERLVEQAPRLAHRMVHAHYLTEAERRDEAREQLQVAMREFDFAPSYVRRRDRKLAKQARQMLTEL